MLPEFGICLFLVLSLQMHQLSRPQDLFQLDFVLNYFLFVCLFLVSHDVGHGALPSFPPELPCAVQAPYATPPKKKKVPLPLPHSSKPILKVWERKIHPASEVFSLLNPTDVNSGIFVMPQPRQHKGGFLGRLLQLQAWAVDFNSFLILNPYQYCSGDTASWRKI